MIPEIPLGEVQPPGKQTSITWKAIQEGVRKIYWPDFDEGPKIVVLPHRIQAKYVCNQCMKSVTITIYTADAVRGHIVKWRRCECGGDMHRRFLGAERDVPVEMQENTYNHVESIEDYFINNDLFQDESGVE